MSSIISFPPCHKQDLCPSLACLLKVIPRATRWRTILLSTVHIFRPMPRSLTILFCDYATPLTFCPAGTVNILETYTASWLLNCCCPIGMAQVATGPLPVASQSSGGSWLQLWCWWSLLIFLIGPSITQVLVRMCMMWHHQLRGHLHTAGSWAISVTAESRQTHTNTDCWSFCWSRGNTKLFLRSQWKMPRIMEILGRLWRSFLILFPGSIKLKPDQEMIQIWVSFFILSSYICLSSSGKIPDHVMSWPSFFSGTQK